VSTVRETEPWESLLESGRADDRLVHDALGREREGTFVPIPDELSWGVRAALEKAGVIELYTHQAQAIYSAFEQPTIITTGTASGKSLCFQVPTLEVLSTDRAARALYLYPTKALAQDQARALHAFGLQRTVRPAIYDGDTPRGSARRSASGAT
jgi:DEAD/DEAH box helicase domain-containing protein